MHSGSSRSTFLCRRLSSGLLCGPHRDKINDPAKSHQRDQKDAQLVPEEFPVISGRLLFVDHLKHAALPSPRGHNAPLSGKPSGRGAAGSTEGLASCAGDPQSTHRSAPQRNGHLYLFPSLDLQIQKSRGNGNSAGDHRRRPTPLKMRPAPGSAGWKGDRRLEELAAMRLGEVHRLPKLETPPGERRDLDKTR